MNKLTSHLNPYAIELCTLARFISDRQWAPAGSGSISFRTNDRQALMTPSFKLKAELSPADLTQFHWQCETPAEIESLEDIHRLIYQAVPNTRIILHIQSWQALVFGRLVHSSQYDCPGYQFPIDCSTETPTLQLQIIDSTSDSTTLAQAITRSSGALLIRSQGLFLWLEDAALAKHWLEAWDFVLHTELEWHKHRGINPALLDPLLLKTAATQDCN